ncbi:MAG: DUF6600 domain-containing protein [Burkholderiales bacterium]
MKHFAIMALAAVLAAPALSQPAPAEDLPGRVGRVADVGGELFLAPQDKPDQWQPVGINYPVAAGDNVWVGHDGRAEIDFGAGQFRLAGDSNIHLSRLDDRQFAVFVAQGRLALRVRVLDPGESARVDTPNAQVVITRAGAYRIDVSDDREHTLLVVREGEANVLTMGAVQQVLPGQSAYVDGMDPQFADVRNGVGTDGFDGWVASRDRLYMRSQSSAYVSPQMVGAADLDRYGTWQQAPEYGSVWYPNDVGPDWAPYRDGYWTDVGVWGPTWVDAAPWGYAPFHYGRWAFIGGRWGWCPGRYVARPLWAPALVAWTGGPGWSFTVSGGPVYGWVPLGWGEPYRPWWNRCSYGCWDRYNKPYAVNTAVYRPNGPPPARYVNWNAPNGVTAVHGNSLVMNRPVTRDLVRVPREAIAAAPVLATAPLMRQDVSRAPARRPGDGAPPPASTVFPAGRPAAFAPSATPAGNAQMQRPGRTPQAAPTPAFPANATQPSGTPGARPAPGSPPPMNATVPTPGAASGTLTRPPSGVPSVAPAPSAPPSSALQRPAPGTPANATPSGTPPLYRAPAPSLQPSPAPQPHDARPARVPTPAPTPVPDANTRSLSRPSPGTPLPPTMTPQPVPQAAPTMRTPTPMPQAAPQVPLSRPAPSVGPSPPPQQQTPAPAPQQRHAPAPEKSSSGNDNLRREDRGGGGNPQGGDRPGR